MDNLLNSNYFKALASIISNRIKSLEIDYVNIENYDLSELLSDANYTFIVNQVSYSLDYDSVSLFLETVYFRINGKKIGNIENKNKLILDSFKKFYDARLNIEYETIGLFDIIATDINRIESDYTYLDSDFTPIHQLMLDNIHKVKINNVEYTYTSKQLEQLLIQIDLLMDEYSPYITSNNSDMYSRLYESYILFDSTTYIKKQEIIKLSIINHFYSTLNKYNGPLIYSILLNKKICSNHTVIDKLLDEILSIYDGEFSIGEQNFEALNSGDLSDEQFDDYLEKELNDGNIYQVESSDYNFLLDCFEEEDFEQNIDNIDSEDEYIDEMHTILYELKQLSSDYNIDYNEIVSFIVSFTYMNLCIKGFKELKEKIEDNCNNICDLFNDDYEFFMEIMNEFKLSLYSFDANSRKNIEEEYFKNYNDNKVLSLYKNICNKKDIS